MELHDLNIPTCDGNETKLKELRRLYANAIASVSDAIEAVRKTTPAMENFPAAAAFEIAYVQHAKRNAQMLGILGELTWILGQLPRPTLEDLGR